eukprot:s935_g15.t1
MEFHAVAQSMKDRRMSSARVDLYEIMCSSQSELTKQVLNLGGKALRFSQAEGDLSTQEGRRKLFINLLIHRPRHLWYSPVCNPWCLWNQFNAMRSLSQNEQIFKNRMESLWQISLGIVLYEFQKSIDSHFHHEQPHGSSMLKVPGAQVICDNTLNCSFDMCTVGNLRDPSSGKAMRKRLNVRSTSQQLHSLLHRRWCQRDHDHQLIAGKTSLNGQPILRSQYSELYPTKFARQVAKTLLSDKSKMHPILVGEHEQVGEEHPTKYRRLDTKLSRAAIDARFPSINWNTVMQLAD